MLESSTTRAPLRVPAPAILPAYPAFGAAFPQARRSVFSFCSILATTSIRRLQAPFGACPRVTPRRAFAGGDQLDPVLMKAPHEMRPGNRYAREGSAGRTL